MKKFFGFGSNTPPPPPPPLRPPAPRVAKSPAPAKQAAPPPAPKPAAPSIVGTWKEPNASDKTEFLADGSVIERPANGEPIRGRYTLQGDHLKVKLDGMPEELAFTVSVKQDSLEMKYPDGQVTNYQRV